MAIRMDKGKERRRTKFIGWTVVLLTVTALLAAGCGAPTGGPQTPTGEARQPFSARRESEDGAIVAWSGYTEGYAPGAEEAFDVTIKNETGEIWRGRYCLQLLDRQAPTVIATLEQRAFTLEPGVGFSDTISVRFPEGLDAGGYGLSLAVRRPGGSMVDLVPIQIGETDEERGPTTQQDMDASLEACPPVEEAEGGAEALVEMAKADLAQRLGISSPENENGIEVQSVEETEFPDASLGVPEPGKTYAQVITPGYVIKLAVAGQVYAYHGSGDRVVAVPAEPAEGEGQPPSGDIAIEGVEVTAAHVAVRGRSTLPDGTCVSTELWADGVQQTWWPADACAPIEQGAWEIVVPLEAGQTLQPGVQYMVRAYQPGGPDIVTTFPFDLDSPPVPPSPAPSEDDPALLLPESAEPLHRASVDLDGDGAHETIVLAGWGGGADRLGYDFLQVFVIACGESGEYLIAWQSEQLPTERAEPLQVEDVNGDGLLPEVLSVQAMGASGETLYILGWHGSGYGWLTPQGGRFDGGESFGENGARVEDVDGDGMAEILASYGPAAGLTDVYEWDGQAYVYRETLGGAETGYERVQVAGAGLSLEVPCGWTQVEAGTWAASEDEALRLGVRWADLEPPQEAEAALLPQPAQVLDAEPVELTWGSGRRFTVEVYGQAVEGAGQAPVEAVETHVLVVVERDGARRAIDVYAGAPSAGELAGLESVLERALASVVLQ